MKLTTAAQMKELDHQAIEKRNIPSIDLMERAAEGVAQAALDLLPRTAGQMPGGAALCGAGNNGGDGIAAARLLFLKGLKIRAFLVGNYEKMTSDALEETRRLSECGVELERFDPDGPGPAGLGDGLRRGDRRPLRRGTVPAHRRRAPPLQQRWTG